jgi:hypothetical protein
MNKFSRTIILAGVIATFFCLPSGFAQSLHDLDLAIARHSYEGLSKEPVQYSFTFNIAKPLLTAYSTFLYKSGPLSQHQQIIFRYENNEYIPHQTTTTLDHVYLNNQISSKRIISPERTIAQTFEYEGQRLLKLTSALEGQELNSRSQFVHVFDTAKRDEAERPQSITVFGRAQLNYLLSYQTKADGSLHSITISESDTQIPAIIYFFYDESGRLEACLHKEGTQFHQLHLYYYQAPPTITPNSSEYQVLHAQALQTAQTIISKNLHILLKN